MHVDIPSLDEIDAGYDGHTVKGIGNIGSSQVYMYIRKNHSWLYNFHTISLTSMYMYNIIQRSFKKYIFSYIVSYEEHKVIVKVHVFFE